MLRRPNYDDYDAMDIDVGDEDGNDGDLLDDDDARLAEAIAQSLRNV
jgi:hypothetical protein